MHSLFFEPAFDYTRSMGRAEDLAELEAHVPWLREDFRTGLAELADSTGAASRRFADDARLLTRLAAAVPRCHGDERGGTPWTSFRREVAVARKTSDQAAGGELRTALRLTTVLPRTLAMLDEGTMPVHRARAFVAELEVYDDGLAAEPADQAALLPAWRIREAVRRAALVADPDSAALRQATRTAGRHLALQAQDDGQACVSMNGPAVPLTRWYATLDERARALRAAGDPRTLDNLRFDLAVASFPCSKRSTTRRTDSGTTSSCATGAATAPPAAPPRPAAATSNHTEPYPEGPTAAWNLAARSRRTHQLKHYGWTPIRTATSTVWTSPSGQVVEVPRTTTSPPGPDTDPTSAPVLPDARQLAGIDADQLTAPSDEDRPPWPERRGETDDEQWTWLHEPLSQVEDPAPF